jgi:hypothetical protein
VKRRELLTGAAALAVAPALPAAEPLVWVPVPDARVRDHGLSDDTIDAIMYALAAATQVPPRILFGIDVAGPAADETRTFVAQRLHGNHFRVVAPVELSDVAITGKVSV